MGRCPQDGRGVFITNKDDTFILKLDAFTLKVETISLKDDTFILKLDTITLKDETISLKLDTITLKVETISLKLNTISLKDDTFTLKDGTFMHKFDAFSFKDETISLKFDTFILKLVIRLFNYSTQKIMDIRFEYKEKLELGECNILVYQDSNQLLAYFPSHIVDTIPTEDSCALYNDFKTQNIFVKLTDNDEKNRRLGSKVFAKISSVKASKTHYLGEFNKALIEGLSLSSYRFENFKTKKSDTLPQFIFDELYKTQLSKIESACNSVFWARNLVNLPFNFLNALDFEKEINKRFEDREVSITFWGKEKLKEEQFGGLLAVNQASETEPRFGILEYKPKNHKNTQPIVLVGKGVVYDTGGLSLKPTENSMDFMKCDMAGLAAVVATLDLQVKNKSDKWIIALCPITDNLIGQHAFAPGNVITMKGGKTVEVMDTDAEGRLILADALEFAKTLNPKLVIDVATLTGSAVRAIGEHAAAIMGNASSAIFHTAAKIGEQTGERIARFPFWDDYNEQLKSDIADLKNLGGPTAGAITAGKFLEHFVAYEWLHLDIAGPAYTHKANHYHTIGGTGFGVRLLNSLIEEI